MTDANLRTTGPETIGIGGRENTTLAMIISGYQWVHSESSVLPAR